MRMLEAFDRAVRAEAADALEEERSGARPLSGPCRSLDRVRSACLRSPLRPGPAQRTDRRGPFGGGGVSGLWPRASSPGRSTAGLSGAWLWLRLPIGDVTDRLTGPRGCFTAGVLTRTVAGVIGVPMGVGALPGIASPIVGVESLAHEESAACSLGGFVSFPSGLGPGGSNPGSWP